MAETYFSASFAFSCTNAEMALMEEAFSVSEDLNCEMEPPSPSPEFLNAFPPTQGGDQWSGFLALFDDPNFPMLGADLSGGNSANEPAISTALISGTTDFQPWAIAELIRRCCQASLGLAPIGFEWAVTCSRARPGEFGGGRCAIFADRVDIQSTGEALNHALAAGTPSRRLPTADPADCPRVGQSLLINAPEFFRDSAFQQWLNNPSPKFTWHRNGDPNEWSDVVVLVDPSLNGEGSDSDMPEHIWRHIVEECRLHLGPAFGGSDHYMVRLTNLDI